MSLKLNAFHFSSDATDGWSNGDLLNVMDQGFKAINPVRIDLSGINHNNATSRPGTEHSSGSRSTEFQVALDGFSTMQLNEAKPQENETKKYVKENVNKGRQRRRNSAELSRGDLAMGLSAPAHRGRRKSLSSLGLIATDIQYSAPTKRYLWSYPNNLGSDDIVESKLHSINETPKKETKPGHFHGATKKTISNQIGGSSSLLPRRRLSLGAQQNLKSPNTVFGFATKKRRASCCTRYGNDSVWRVKIHRRSLNIDDDCETRPQNPSDFCQLKNRRVSLPSISSFAGQTSITGRTSILPKIGRRNSLAGEQLEEL